MLDIHIPQLVGYALAVLFAFAGAFATSWALVRLGRRRKVRRGHRWEWVGLEWKAE